MVFLHSDALNLPFQENTVTTIISENLLHCLSDTRILLAQLKNLKSKDGRMYFTTLVKNGRFADSYLQTLADSGKLIARTVDDHKDIFNETGLFAQFETKGNILLIQCEQ